MTHLSANSPDGVIAEEVGGSRDAWEQMLACLDLSPCGKDAYSGSHYPATGHLFGGQLAAQAVVAASRTVGPDKHCASLQISMLRTGRPESPLVHRVATVHEGRNYATRQVEGWQGERLVYSATILWHKGGDSLAHQEPAPVVQAPERLRTSEEWLRDSTDPMALYWRRPRPVELRHTEFPPYVVPAPKHQATQDVWMRMGGRVPDDSVLRAAVGAFVTDYSIMEPALRRHGLHRGTGGTAVLTLTHDMWWHGPPTVEDEMLYSQFSPSMATGRALSIGYLYGATGGLLATVAQQASMGQPRARGRSTIVE